MMVRFLAALAVAALAAIGSQAQELGDSGRTEWNLPPYRIILKTNLDEAGPSDELTVESGGKVVFTLADAFVRSELTVGQETVADDFGKPMPGHDRQDEPGHDPLGLGFPNLVFADYTGGMHCCFKAVILMFDRTFRTQIIDLYDPGGNFHAVEGRKSLVLEATDANFKEWRSSPADSPFPTVMLSYDRATGRYIADAELMRGPLPEPDELAHMKDRAREHQQAFIDDRFTDYEVGALTSPMLEMIYTGHIADAHAFLAEAWIGGADKREAYWSLLTRCKLRASPYWPAVAKINGLAADPPVNGCGPRDR